MILDILLIFLLEKENVLLVDTASLVIDFGLLRHDCLQAVQPRYSSLSDWCLCRAQSHQQHTADSASRTQMCTNSESIGTRVLYVWSYSNVCSAALRDVTWVVLGLAAGTFEGWTSGCV